MTSTKTERKIKAKDLMDIKLLFAVLIILGGLIDVYHVQDYIRNQEYITVSTTGNTGLDNIHLQEIDTSYDISKIVTTGGYRLTEEQFFNSIFMLCVGFTMILYGILKWHLWWMNKEFEIKIENLSKK